MPPARDSRLHMNQPAAGDRSIITPLQDTNKLMPLSETTRAVLRTHGAVCLYVLVFLGLFAVALLALMFPPP
jgi:hypothetical protein